MGSPNDLPFFEWQVEMPLVTNRFFLYDMLKVVGWTGLVLFVILGGIAVATGSVEHMPVIFGMFALILFGFLLLALAISLVFFGNRYPTRFVVAPAGIGWESMSRRGNAANRAAVVAGVLAGSAGAAGAGLLAAANETGLLDWHEIRKVKKYPEERVITVMNSWRVVIRLYCTPENYRYVADLVDWYRAMAAGGRTC
jgi:hypothetical protein